MCSHVSLTLHSQKEIERPQTGCDRLVMMTNGPAAKIGEIMDIPFKRPRDRDRIMETLEYYKLRNYAHLYNRYAHDEDAK
jgi:bicarbonate transport system ATP-binding protein